MVNVQHKTSLYNKLILLNIITIVTLYRNWLIACRNRKNKMKRICINCGSSPGIDPFYLDAARKLGQGLAANNIELVYGGADVGLMGEVADTVMNAGGIAIGVIPKSFAHKVSHQGLTKLHVVDSMHERKKMMFDLSDGFIALPGGFGTLEELTELLTWTQLGLHKKPCGLINVGGYYNSLLSFFDNAVAKGFMKKEHREMLLVTNNVDEMFAYFQSYNAPVLDKWVDVKTRT